MRLRAALKMRFEDTEAQMQQDYDSQALKARELEKILKESRLRLVSCNI